MKKITLFFVCVGLLFGADCANKDDCYQKASTTKDQKESLSFLQKACELENNDACAALGYIIAQNDVENGMKMIQNSCEANSALACAILANIAKDAKTNDEQMLKQKACNNKLSVVSVRFLNSIEMENPCKK